ncbi:MAG: TadE/TadG family type IV pilus assembly protein [Alphaproteobacteria bacterium]
MLVKQIKKSISRFAKADSGQFAIWFGVAAFPVLVATTYVVDFRGVEKDRASIKSALDAAVLTAVSNESVTTSQKQDLAIEVFNAHYAGQAKLVLDVNATDGRVEMSAKGMKEASLARSVGVAGFEVGELSIAEMNRENTICVLALAGEGEGKLRFLDSTEFNSPSCAVQSNSKHPQGILSSSRYDPIAKSFCSAGGGDGKFKPAMRGECRVIDDPYENRVAPKAGVCMPNTIFAGGTNPLPTEAEAQSSPFGRGADPSGIVYLPPMIVSILGEKAYSHIGVPGVANIVDGQHQHYHCDAITGNCQLGEMHSIWDIHAPLPESRMETLGVSAADLRRVLADYGPEMVGQRESANYTADNGIYYPGTYCGGLTVDGVNVTFMPGTYIIKDGPLTFKNGAEADAQDVSYVLTGNNAVVTVESGSYVDIKAPRSGSMAGLAFFQDRNGSTSSTGGGTGSLQNNLAYMSSAAESIYADEAPSSDPSAPSGITGVNLISSGGELNVTGTMYFPTQALDVLGDSVLGARAPATSFIAHQVTFAGETKAAVSVDYVKGGIPPLLPKSDDGARLVK